MLLFLLLVGIIFEYAQHGEQKDDETFIDLASWWGRRERYTMYLSSYAYYQYTFFVYCTVLYSNCGIQRKSRHIHILVPLLRGRGPP